ncbi:NUDIX hydrolase [Nocardia vinacea]|uniref:NUDIX hydrolase n=1 Tax=Nocardia vinacea TaxID=96468 RepID=UPI002E110FF3|nr:NUDIX hydrolase [Nocardia vinacea]
MDSDATNQFQIQVTARALVTRGEDLLLVSNDGRVWYTPGGRLQPGESLHDCIRREVHEETGLHVTAGELVHVFEYWEAEHHRHKVECYFLARLESGELDQDWADLDGPVEHMRFFTPAEVRAAEHIYPQFLKKGQWRTGKDIYMGFEK